MLLQAEVQLAQEQARDAANKWQQTETARLQLEGLLGQALLARAELLQQRNALSVEKQGLQDSCASLEEGLSAKEVTLPYQDQIRDRVVSAWATWGQHPLLLAPVCCPSLVTGAFTLHAQPGSCSDLLLTIEQA